MYGCSLGLELHPDIRLPLAEQIRLYKQVGFDAFFAYWKKDLDIAELRRVADEEGMRFMTLHAPTHKLCNMWEPTDLTQAAIDELLACLRACAEHAVPMMVAHAYYGFGKHEPDEFGIKNFEIIVKEAERLGVTIAFENTEGEEYLAALLDHFHDNPHVGFCWDCGHEMCYTHYDLLALHGDCLIATHLNDNLGTKATDGTITGRDDLHMLPFDGIGDWEDIVDRLNSCNFNDVLMFELKPKSQPGRHENDVYYRMDPVDYVTAAYVRCCRVAALKMRRGKKN
ncbi:MAG: sugar phosphate isomerase/epimerase [Clostridiales bacterium]|nr:sugar phosphate isomerase/epimerase [Clostridiales bacterium]